MTLINYTGLRYAATQLCRKDGVKEGTKGAKNCKEELKLVKEFSEYMRDLEEISVEVQEKAEQIQQYHTNTYKYTGSKRAPEDLAKEFSKRASSWSTSEPYIKSIQNIVKDMESQGVEMDKNYLAMAKTFRDLLKELYSTCKEMEDLCWSTNRKFGLD